VSEGDTRIRLDRWLCHARVFKTRSLAADRISGGGIRVNGAPCRKPAQMVGPGDVVTVVTDARTRALRFVAPGERRGPATEAQSLYVALDEGEGEGNAVCDPLPSPDALEPPGEGD